MSSQDYAVLLVVDFNKGDLVYVYVPAIPRGMVKKCTMRWHGPFEVDSNEKEGRSYWVKTNNKTRLIHETRLKRTKRNVDHRGIKTQNERFTQ